MKTESVTVKAIIDKSNLDKAYKAIKKGGQQAVDRALARAMKAGAAAFTSSAKGGAPKIYKIKPSELKGMTSTNKNELTAKSRLLSVGKSPSHFGMTPGVYSSQARKTVKGRKKATATIKKGRKGVVPGAFVANPSKVNGGTLMLWQRTKGRFPGTHNAAMEPVRRVSAAQMLTDKDVSEAVMKAINETYEKRLDHELERLGL